MTKVGLGGEKEFEGDVCGLRRIIQEFLGVVERRKLGTELAVFVHCTAVSIDRIKRLRMKCYVQCRIRVLYISFGDSPAASCLKGSLEAWLWSSIWGTGRLR